MTSNTNNSCTCGGSPGQDTLIAEDEEQFDAVIAFWKKRPGALIPVLQAAQQKFGYLSDSILRKISMDLDEPMSKVFGVVTFYSFFSRVPRGKFLIRVCLGTACYVRGANEVLAALETQLKIRVGQTTADLLFTLEVGRCFGACGLAPVIMINDTIHQSVQSSDVERILKSYRTRAKAAKEVTR